MFSSFSRPFVRPLSRLLAFAVLALAALWAPAASATVRISVDLSSQRMMVTSSSGERYNWAISSGRMGFVTPRGTYRPQSLRRMHYSSRYNNAPMPHSIFFHKGWAIHGTSAVRDLGRPASHGCIRLAPGNAAKLFSMVQREGAVININGQPPHMMNIAKKKTNAQVAKANAKKRVNVATTRRAAAPMAFAPVHRAPGVKAWQQRPGR
jgi:hypothetical protein